MLPTITRTDSCKGCGKCVLVCTFGVHTQDPAGSVPQSSGITRCMSCGHCVAICPQNAIVHSAFPAGTINTVTDQEMPSSSEVIELLRTRRSIRAFEEKPIEKTLIEQILEAAQYAPSSHNSQTTNYIVVQNKTLLDELVKDTGKALSKVSSMLNNPLFRPAVTIILGKQAEDTLKVAPNITFFAKEINQGIDRVLYSAPVAILFHADERKLYSEVNAELAFQNASLMAYSLGLGSVRASFLVMAFERDRSMAKKVGLPEHHKIYTGMAIGYPRFVFKKWMVKKNPEVTWF